ncbi:sulfite exporter TauE/SafE family protein [Saccharopolyspora sp. WRP15-2]|uniref:Probable membrane transporter protein n=1 Tax=Saccharopolyspora oryzae TaxID=2997343 RepID=A0ABT4V705_9PSEU|nr:sulfite exporter TauE/SafE family protein [Saccharopolyspora oryzae]MDA3629750.1 sulfite exporter TauE/SafE family protein [Saccharopolyspora oryzae]
MLEFIALLLVGVAAGALNAVGGGGTFVALPALVAAGLPAVTANASSTVALLPGALASAWAYRNELVQVGTTSRTALTTTSLVGSALGAGLLLVLPSESFRVAVPWLLAFATVVLAFGRTASRLLSTAIGHPIDLSTRSVLIGQFVLAAYGGYFGGAVGILMLAFWSVGLGLDPAKGNPTRVAQLAAIYATAAALFLVASDVWSYPGPVIAVLIGAIGGGFAGARIARRLPARALRGIVLTTATTMTALYFLRS